MYFVSLHFADAFSSSDGLNGGYSLPRSVNNYELHDSCLIELRKQMNLEKHASLVYKQMAFHFGSVKVVRKGFAKMFEHHSEEEHEHSNKFIKYIDLRGATIDSFNITVSFPFKSTIDNFLTPKSTIRCHRKHHGQTHWKRWKMPSNWNIMLPMKLFAFIVLRRKHAKMSM